MSLDRELDASVVAILRARGRVAPGMPDAVDDDSDLHELTGFETLPLVRRANGQCDGIRSGAVYSSNLTAEVPDCRHRVDQFEVPIESMRSGHRLEQ
jgi:hypothetical protein